MACVLVRPSAGYPKYGLGGWEAPPAMGWEGHHEVLVLVGLFDPATELLKGGKGAR